MDEEAWLTVRRVGRRALLLEVDSGEAAQALYAELLRRQGCAELPEAAEIVPAARTVLVDGVDDQAAWAALVRDWRLPAATGGSGPLVELPTVYDGADLAEVAVRWGVRIDEAVRIHCAVEYRVAFCGFAPGFAYLTGLDARYEVPRRATPRPVVRAGSVALAGPYTGVYPVASPGGWQLLGHTEVRLWDSAGDPAALLVPGVRVRFVPVAGAGGAPC